MRTYISPISPLYLPRRYKPVERKPRRFNPLLVPKQLQAGSTLNLNPNPNPNPNPNAKPQPDT